MVFAAMRLDKLGQSLRGHGVGDYNRAGLVFENDCRYHGDKAVAVELSAVGEDAARPVDVGVKDYAEIGVRALDPLSIITEDSGFGT